MSEAITAGGRHRVEALPQGPGFVPALDALAAEGWELVACHPGEAQRSRLDPRPVPAWICVLRRPAGVVTDPMTVG